MNDISTETNIKYRIKLYFIVKGATTFLNSPFQQKTYMNVIQRDIIKLKKSVRNSQKNPDQCSYRKKWIILTLN